MKRFLCGLLFVVAGSLHAASTLKVVSAGPVGETATMAEANEVRVVFSEPMVVVGKIALPVTAPFFTITPTVKGAIRWSGTTTLIFTPAKGELPYASRFEVAIAPTARSVAGNTLDKPYRFSFTTPTVRLLNTQWYRKESGAYVIGLTFNQKVDPPAILEHLQLRTIQHEFTPPTLQPAGAERIKAKEPQALPAFEAKKAKAAQNAAGGKGVFFFHTTRWEVKHLGRPRPDLLVVETKPNVEPDSWLQVFLDDQLVQGSRNVRAGRSQEFTIQLEPMLFVEKMECTAACDPEAYNPIILRSNGGLRYEAVQKAVSVTDITDPAREVALKPQPREREYDYPSTTWSLDYLGVSILPAHKYAIRVDPTLTAEDGQTLGYTWMAIVEYWHKSAFISFGDGQGVWEASGGGILPFHARNLRSVQQWLAPLTVEQLMPTILQLQTNGFRTRPPSGGPHERKLAPVADKTQSYGLDITPAVGADAQGLLWAAVKPGQAVDQSKVYDPSIRATIVQATNLGISVKDSPQNTLIFVTRLDDASPVAGAVVSLRTTENRVFWSGTTDAKGLAVAPNTDLRKTVRQAKKAESANADEMQQEEDYDESWRALGDLHFIAVAEKDGDVAYVGSDWNEGIVPWEFGVRFDVNEAQPLLRGTIFSDRGVYKLGEEVHAKLIVRSDTPGGMQLLPAGTKADVELRDSHDKVVEKKALTLGEWSSAEWVFRVPGGTPLGTYSLRAQIEGQRDRITGNFLVAAYRRPEFRTDAALTAPSSLAGTKLDGTITGRYLHGAPMAGRGVSWSWAMRALSEAPTPILDRWERESYTFLGYDDTRSSSWRPVTSKEAKLDAKGTLALSLPTELKEGWPYEYRLEGEVTDVTRQKIAGRATYRIDPAPWYLGLKNPPFFSDAAKGIDTEVLAAALDGRPVAGVDVKVDLIRMQWVSVRQAVGNGFYEWQTEQKQVVAGTWNVTTGETPKPLHIPLSEGGQYVLMATAGDAEGRSTTTRMWFYAMGAGYTAWERFDHPRIDLVPDKKTYKPGETAKIMIKSPWEKATALLTTEREGIRTWQQFELTSTQQTITVPISEKEIPNFYVSVLLVKGRTREAVTEDEGDPGKPAFRLGYVELKVADDSKRLKVDLKANRDEFRPASKAKIEVNVRDRAGKPSQSEVTLWAVDYGVLSLTDYRTPDVLASIYLEKALQVVTEDSRERIVSRRVLTPKGAADGGGGGRDAGAGTLRKDFRVLAFWVGSIVTDRNGRARTEITLPESLSTYRIMAVAGDRGSRFGWAQNEIVINRPLMAQAAFPRFMVVGDKAYFGGTVFSQKASGTANVTIRSLDPSILEIAGGTASVNVTPGSSTEVRFDATAKAVGEARIQMRVSMGRESDAFEDVIPVRWIAPPETVAAYGEAKPQATETLEVPQNVVPNFGGLRVELSSTAMVGLGEGARYLVEYPYGCAEQRASAALALVLSSDLGEAFRLPGIDVTRTKPLAQSTLAELPNFQCGDGGFAFWPGECSSSSPYLTAWVLHVFHRARSLGYTVDADTLQRAYTYLEQKLNEPKPQNEAWMPTYTAWQAFVVRTLSDGGRNVDSHLTRLYGYRDRMPVFALSFLADALIKKGEQGARLEELQRRIMNSILPEASTAHVSELSDPFLLWLWSSNARSTAIVLGTQVRKGDNEALVKQMVRWLMSVRKKGRWDNTQENAWAMESLIDYYRKYEAESPDFAAVVTAGAQALVREEFRGRSTDTRVREFPMPQLQSMRREAAQVPILFDRQGTGTLFYLMRLRYASADAKLIPMNQGFSVERSYALQSGGPAATTFKAGDLIRVALKIRNTKERRFVAVSDPIPAGTEPVESWFATTASAAAEEQSENDARDWMSWMERGGWDHFERHDDRVNVFATRLGEGTHEYVYLVRATTAGTFTAAPTYAEEMYEPEVHGRTGTATVEVTR